MERKMFLVCLVLALVLLAYYLTKIEDRDQKHFEEKLIQILEDRVQKHLEEKLSVIQSLHGSNADMVRKDFEDGIQKKLDEKVSIIKNLEDRVQKHLEEKLTVIQSLHETKVGMVRKDLEDGFQKKLDEKVSIIKNLEGKVQTKLEEKVRVIQSLHERIVKLEMDPEAFHIFIWKITNFENQVKNNRYMESVPFYAYGYKLMLDLYPNGVGEGKNTHISIFIRVMKGEYDAILPWGFSKKVTFTLIDQQDNPDHREDVAMGFTADPNIQNFKKPVEGEDRVGLGYREFVSHSVLRTRRFIVDDTIFIKVQVAKTSSWF